MKYSVLLMCPISMGFFGFLPNAECAVKKIFKLGQNFKFLVVTVLSYCVVQVQSPVTVHLNFFRHACGSGAPVMSETTRNARANFLRMVLH
jgi:hypothetical protein